MIGGDFLQLTPGRGPSSVPVLGPWHELLAWCLLVKAGESAVSECHMIYPLNHPEKQPVSKRSPGVYWQVRLPDLWSDPGLPVDFSSSFSTQMQTIPWSEPWFIHVFLPIGPSQYFPTKIQHPCPHLFFLPRPVKCKSHKFTRNIHKQSPVYTQKPTPSIHQTISELLKNLKSSAKKVFLLQFPGFSRSKKPETSPSPHLFFLRPFARNRRTTGTGRKHGEGHRGVECQPRDGGPGSKTDMARSYLGTFWSRPDGG
jgi:hypothetical protein